MNGRLQYLLSAFNASVLTRPEFDELMMMAAMDEHEAQIRAWMMTDLEAVDPSQYNKEYWQEFFRARMIGRNGRNEHATDATTEELGIRNRELGRKVFPLYRRPAFKWIAAAAVIIIIAAVAYLSTVGGDANKGRTEVATTHDVAAPSNTRAVITLANGTKVYLDSAGNGTIAQENNVAVVKNANGEIEYRGQKSEVGGQIAYNTMLNPRGSKVIALTLSDGTRVWLNSESSLKYPTAFTASAREVEITGEAYFEVRHNAAQPFKVHLPNGSVVEDLGTEFNINAYPDENDVKTTLVQGSVKISSRLSALAVKLKPGEQLIQLPNHQITKSPDLEETLAWKNGSFSFNRTNIVSIMKQVERWYDVQVVMSDEVKSMDFTGGIARTENVSQVLKMLEKTGVLHFKIEGKRITVSK